MLPNPRQTSAFRILFTFAMVAAWHEHAAAQSDPNQNPPIRVLLFASNEAQKWHNWERTTPAIKAALQRDARINVGFAT